MNLIVITSSINVGENPFTYSSVRSIYNERERFDQTIITLNSLNKIKDKHIMFLESTSVNLDFKQEILKYVNWYIDLSTHSYVSKFTNSAIKGLGEAALLRVGIARDIIAQYDNLYKISGRYYLNEFFTPSSWDNNYTIFKENQEAKILYTQFYKISQNDYPLFFYNLENMFIFKFVDSIESFFYSNFKKIKKIDKLGVSGLVGVSGIKMEE